MALGPSSRYHGVPTEQVRMRAGRVVTAITLRLLPTVDGESYPVREDDRLDTIAHRSYDDATRFWRIADANTELEARRLVEPGRVIVVPKAEE